MSYSDDAWAIYKEADGDTNKAADAIYAGPKRLAWYVISLGLVAIARKKRANRRRELRALIRPEFVKAPGGPTGSVVMTEKSKQNLLDYAKELYGDDGWIIGNLNIGDMTKEELIAQAASERKSAAGSIRNANMYEAMAEPMLPGQKVRSHWTKKAFNALRDSLLPSHQSP
jgi:hypothetical protein